MGCVGLGLNLLVLSFLHGKLHPEPPFFCNASSQWLMHDRLDHDHDHGDGHGHGHDHGHAHEHEHDHSSTHRHETLHEEDAATRINDGTAPEAEARPTLVSILATISSSLV